MEDRIHHANRITGRITARYVIVLRQRKLSLDRGFRPGRLLSVLEASSLVYTVGQIGSNWIRSFVRASRRQLVLGGETSVNRLINVTICVERKP